jgi:hypothetical protein
MRLYDQIILAETRKCNYQVSGWSRKGPRKLTVTALLVMMLSRRSLSRTLFSLYPNRIEP